MAAISMGKPATGGLQRHIGFRGGASIRRCAALGVIDGPEMIAAATAMQGAAAIALAKPHLAGRLAHAIMRVSGARYKTDECRNVATGHAIQALGKFVNLVEDQGAVVAFVRAQLDNPRPATRKKAEAFLRKRGGRCRTA